jgi:tetratricopeptide (TPR) repeat protein
MDRAIYCWEKALELDPQQPQTHARLAEAWWTLGDLDKARMHYEAEMALGSEDANLLLDFGEMLLEMDEVTEAETRFREALEASPQNVSAHFGLGEVSLKRGKAEEALERFRLVLKLDPAMQGAHAKMARALVKLGKVNEAAKHVVIELRQSGADPQMLQELGELLIEAQLSRHASKVLSRLVELRPDDPYAHHNLAVSYFMMGRYDDGITHCQKALKLKADYPLATYNLALAYMQKGDRDRARQYAARALEMAPEDTHIVDLARELGTTGWLGRIRGKLSRWSRKGQPRHAG